MVTTVTDAIVSAFIGAASGSVVSTLMVHWLTRSRDREKWILDNKKQEFKELITALAVSYKSAGSFPRQVCDEDADLIADHVNEVLRIASDRLFITKDLDLRRLRRRWSESVAECRKENAPHNRLVLDIAYRSISDEIVAAAGRAVPKSTLQRLRFWKGSGG
jgi:hypothetical protein